MKVFAATIALAAVAAAQRGGGGGGQQGTMGMGDFSRPTRPEWTGSGPRPTRPDGTMGMGDFSRPTRPEWTGSGPRPTRPDGSMGMGDGTRPTRPEWTGSGPRPTRPDGSMGMGDISTSAAPAEVTDSRVTSLTVAVSDSTNGVVQVRYTTPDAQVANNPQVQRTLEHLERAQEQLSTLQNHVAQLQNELDSSSSDNTELQRRLQLALAARDSQLSETESALRDYQGAVSAASSASTATPSSSSVSSNGSNGLSNTVLAVIVAAIVVLIVVAVIAIMLSKGNKASTKDGSRNYEDGNTAFDNPVYDLKSNVIAGSPPSPGEDAYLTVESETGSVA